MTFDTLQYVDAAGDTQEVALNGQNLARRGSAVKLVFTPASHAVSTFTITWAQPPEYGIAIRFKSRCKIYANRTSVNGAPNSFSEGTILFQGRMTKLRRSTSNVSMVMTLSDLWWDLERLTFMQPWSVISDNTGDAIGYTTFTWPDLVLFQSFAGYAYDPAPVTHHITSWQQIQDIINYATGYSFGINAVQVQLAGAAVFTPRYVPFYPLRSAKCADALKTCLRPHPGVFTEVDYSTEPPTLHFRNRAAMTAVTLPYKSKLDDGTIHVATDIEALPELVPDNVCIYYKLAGELNGQPANSYTSDYYPAINLNVTGPVALGDPVGGSAAPYVKNGLPNRGLAADVLANGVTAVIACRPPNNLLDLDYSVDVSGPSTTITRKNVVSQALNPADYTLWEDRVSSLAPEALGGQIPDSGVGVLQLVNAGAYNAATNPKGIQIMGDDGVDYSATYAAVLPYFTNDDLYTWMRRTDNKQPIKAIKCTVKALFTYVKNTEIGAVTYKDKTKEHEHSFTILLTDAPTGKYTLKQETTQTETIPTGLAEGIYTELADLQWRVRHEIIQEAADSSSLPTLLKPGKHLVNLSGGDAAWTTMNAIVERVNIEFFRTAANRMVARQSISCGPVDHLEPGYLVQLLNMFLNRNRSGIDASQRLTGTSNNQVDLTSSPAAGASDAGTALPSSMHFVFVDADNNHTVLKMDSEGGMFHGR